jgi:hypothetical protein
MGDFVAASALYDREKTEDEVRAMTSAQLEAERAATQRDLDWLRALIDRSRGEIERATAELRHDIARRYLRRVTAEQKWRSG